MTARMLALVALAACSDGALGPDAGADAGVGVDAPPGCTRPSLDAPWLLPLVTDVVTQLAAAPRATTTQRATARAYLEAQLTAYGWQPQQHAYATGANVVATIPATRGNAPEVIIGAHFDTVMGSPGANDNASGSAVVLAIARALAEVPCRSAPVTVVLFDQEEVGLFGSRAFAMTRSPSAVRSVHTFDQVSWDQDGDRRFELELPTLALETEYLAAAQVVGVELTVTATQGTDHEAFRDRGFEAVGLSEEYVGGDTSPHRHAATDTPATVDLAYLGLAAKLGIQVLVTEVSE